MLPFEQHHARGKTTFSILFYPYLLPLSAEALTVAIEAFSVFFVALPPTLEAFSAAFWAHQNASEALPAASETFSLSDALVTLSFVLFSCLCPPAGGPAAQSNEIIERGEPLTMQRFGDSSSSFALFCSFFTIAFSFAFLCLWRGSLLHKAITRRRDKPKKDFLQSSPLTAIPSSLSFFYS